MDQFIWLCVQSGVVMVWKADSKGRLQQSPQHQHHCQEPLSQIIFKPLPPPDPATYVLNKV